MISQIFILQALTLNYTMTVSVVQKFDDGTFCPNTTATVLFTDSGMDAAAACSPAKGACNLNYAYSSSNYTGVQYGPFLAGPPNLSPVRYYKRYDIELYLQQS